MELIETLIEIFLTAVKLLCGLILIRSIFEILPEIEKHNEYKKKTCCKIRGKVIDIKKRQIYINPDRGIGYAYELFAVVSYAVNDQQHPKTALISLGKVISTPFNRLARNGAVKRARSMIEKDVDVLLDVETSAVFSEAIHKKYINNIILNSLIDTINILIVFSGAAIVGYFFIVLMDWINVFK